MMYECRSLNNSHGPLAKWFRDSFSMLFQRRYYICVPIKYVMCIHMCVCVCMYVGVCVMCLHTRTHTHTHMHTHGTHTHTLACILTHTHSHVHPLHAHTRKHRYTHTHVHTHINTFTHTHTQTQTHRVCVHVRARGSNLTVVRPFPKKGVPGVLPGKFWKNAACWCILVLFKGYLINNHNHEDGSFMINKTFQIH